MAASQPSLKLLTTPIAYMTSLCQNPFIDKSYTNPGDSLRNDYRYFCPVVKDAYLKNPAVIAQGARDVGKEWVLLSFGPDNTNDGAIAAMVGDTYFYNIGGIYYDATNGTVSRGDIVRMGP